MKIWLRSIPFLLIPVTLLAWIGWQDLVPARFYMEDPAALVQLPIGTAMMSILGITLWFVCAALGLFSATLCGGRVRISLIAISVFCLVLGLDDLLLIHEDLLPSLLASDKHWRKVVEACLFASYGLALGTWILAFRKNFSPLHWSFLLASLLLFAASMGIDLVRSLHFFDPWSRIVKDEDFAILVEDGPKIVGLFCWVLFFWHYCKSAIQDHRSA